MASQADVADHLGLSQAAIAKLVRAGILPKAPPREYDVDACRAAYLKWLRVGRRGRGSAASLTELRRQRVAIEIELKRYELAERRRVMIRVTDIVPALERQMTALRQHLLAIGPKLAPIVRPDAPAEAQALIDAAIDEALTELSSGDFGGATRQRQRPQRV